MSVEPPDFAPGLSEALRRAFPGHKGVTGLRRLSGGASQETWSFALTAADGAVQELILRRAPGGVRQGGSGTAVPLATEADVIAAARLAGVSAPRVFLVLQPDDAAGEGYVMEHVAGETIARKILRDAPFADIRPKLAAQCGAALARLHQIKPENVPGLRSLTGPEQLQTYRDLYDSYDQPKPVFELAFAVLAERLQPPARLHVVHGDFRLGNLMIAPDRGLASVLDWELVHLGDPIEDLGWICVNSWRFGQSQNTVGGFGAVEDLLRGYAEAGGTQVSAEEVKTWEIFGTLKWGIMCMTMYEAFTRGMDRSVERAAIGRRSSETEIDLVNLLIGAGA